VQVKSRECIALLFFEGRVQHAHVWGKGVPEERLSRTLLLHIHLQGYMLKFTPRFSQAWAKMIDVEGGINPLVKYEALDSTGYIFALITYEQEDGVKVY
jgi:hypothetical protein